jgi:hypothetical protein
LIISLRKFLWRSLVGFCWGVFSISLPVSAAELETTQVFISNGQLEYVGELDDGANQRLFDLYEKLANKPTLLSIRSPGGEVNTGMALGAWVYAHQLNVRVLEFCLSSCANYVFTAAKQKIVSNFAVVGYHGGPGDVKNLKFDAKTEALLSTLGPEARKTMMDDFAKTIRLDGQREVAYFRKIGVRSDISSLGQDDQYEKFTSGAAGWTYSQEDFALLGVRNITVINPPWKPGGLLHGIVFATIPVSKIPAPPRP